MRDARPPKENDGGSSLTVTDPLDALRYGTSEHIADLLTSLLGVMERDYYRNSDPKARGEFTPTLPPGYAKALTDVSGREVPAWSSDEAQEALAWMYAQPC